MLQALKDFGNFVGLEKGFEVELQKKVNTGDKIVILNIDQNLSLKEEKRIEYDKKEYKDPYLLYYKGGKESVTGATGILGISPFFLVISNIIENKLNKSNEYDEIYKKWYSFKLDTKYQQYLKDDEVVDKELISAFNANGIALSENAKIFKIGERNWKIKGDEIWLYKIETDKDKQLNIYDLFINEFLEFLKTNSEEIKDIGEEIKKIGGKGEQWVYFNSFKGKPTEDIHKKFIDYYIKDAPQNKQIENIKGKCSLCGETSELCYPRLPFFSLDVSNYSHNLIHNDLENSRFRVCKNCESKIVSGWNYLNNLFRGGYTLIPKLRRDISSKELLKEFIKIVRSDISDFEKLNEVLNHRMDKEIELSFIVMKKGKKTNIEKFVGNYKTFAIEFEKENLIKDDELSYVDCESKKIDIPQINSFFELERILKFFFVNDKNFPLHQKFYIYNLYNQDLPKNMDSNFKHLLYVHRDELFSLIYETDVSALKRKTLNEICFNFLLYEIRKQREFWGKNADKNICFKIMEALNYYYFFKTKLLNENKMKTQIIDLKSKFEILKDENITDDEKSEVFSEIQKMVEQDDRIVYYLIGQFIQKIDNMRGYAKKNKIFNDFVQNINKKNVKQRFAEDILRKQNYYIEQLNPRAKLVFDVMSNNMDNLFEYEPYEEIVIYTITGYYSNNMLN